MPKRKKNKVAGPEKKSEAPQAKSPADAAPEVEPVPPAPQPSNDPYLPQIVCVVKHRTYDDKGKRYGHVGIVQHRSPSKMKLNGGKEFASWAQLTLDGIVFGMPERFDTFTIKDEAIAHAKYAASVAP